MSTSMCDGDGVLMWARLCDGESVLVCEKDPHTHTTGPHKWEHSTCETHRRNDGFLLSLDLTVTIPILPVPFETCQMAHRAFSCVPFDRGVCGCAGPDDQKLISIRWPPGR